MPGLSQLRRTWPGSLGPGCTGRPGRARLPRRPRCRAVAAVAPPSRLGARGGRHAAWMPELLGAGIASPPSGLPAKARTGCCTCSAWAAPLGRPSSPSM
eukprot:3241586-Alexandrium_andersonii.AAC.1